MTKKIYIFLICCLAGLMSFDNLAKGADFDLAKTEGQMRTWRNLDGLPSDLVTAIIQTRDGFLWVGTSAGLVRFDGVKFTEVQLVVSPSKNPISITVLCEDSEGRLWVGTKEDGLFRLEGGRVRHFTKVWGLLDADITSLAADKRGFVWIGSKSGLNVWTGKQFLVFTAKDGLPDEQVSGVNVARSGSVWITTRTGMCRLVDGHIIPYAFQTDSQGRSPEYLGAYEDHHGNLWAFGDTYLNNLTEGKRFNYFHTSESASVRIWSLCEGRDGRLWIGTSGQGVFCFEDGHFQPVSLGESRWGYDVRAICEDQEGNLWLGTYGGGLVQLRPRPVHILQARQGLPESSPTALALGTGGRLYAGFQRGGLFVHKSKGFDLADDSGGRGLQCFVSSVCVAQDGTVWAGTLGEGLFGLHNGRELRLTTANGLSDNTVLAVCADRQGGIWASTAGALHCFNGKSMIRFIAGQDLPAEPVVAMIPSEASGLWVGTQKGQILRGENGKFTNLGLSKDFGQYPVLVLYEGEKSRLWVGTDGGGLTCLVNGRATNWNSNIGLPSDVVAGVVEDEVKNLWLATGAGIYRINRSDVRKMIEDPSLPIVCRLMSDAKTAPGSSIICGGTRALLSPDMELWFATSKGLLTVGTHQSDIFSSMIPIYVENVAFNGESPTSMLPGRLWSPVVTNSIPLEAPVDLRTMEIHFTALNFTALDKVHFRHKLEGFDPDWVDDAGARSARYGRIPPGNYRFRVAASTGDGEWLEATNVFAFVVPTPLYFQKWAICLYGVLAVALVSVGVRLISHRRLRVTLARLGQQQSLERERMRIARDMHDEIGSKLTKISFLSERARGDIKTAGPLAEKIESIALTSRELLKTMDEIVWVVNPRNDTLEKLVIYLNYYAIEYFQNTSIECELRMPQEIPACPLSSEARHNLFLTFEEALNNVLKHSGGTKVKVQMTIDSQGFELKVSDNGKGFDESALTGAGVHTRGGRGGNGLKNMRQRLAATGGECVISSQPGNGTTVTICVPLNRKTYRK